MDLFSSPCSGIFFYVQKNKKVRTIEIKEFSSPCSGIFFLLDEYILEEYMKELIVFAPLFGDIFLFYDFYYVLDEIFKFSPPCSGIFFYSCFRDCLWYRYSHRYFRRNPQTNVLRAININRQSLFI